MNSILVFFVVLAASASSIKCKEVCYENLGCFKDTSPFGGTLLRPIGRLPSSPEKISTTFYLHNENADGQLMSSGDVPSSFISSIPTTVIIHGFGNSKDSDWVVDMKDALLENDRVNVIVVDWKEGSTLPYELAINNARVVGAVIANFLKEFINKRVLKASDIHIIGFSLGAQTAGYVGERINKIRRITGLDPAGPYFESTPNEVRLDKTDAEFVDVIHTNGLKILKDFGFGISTSSGHVDFYPNGGQTQPGCKSTNIANIWDSISTIFQNFNFDDATEEIACSHSSSHQFFIASIKSKCGYSAYTCRSYSEFQKGNCNTCPSGGCNKMGYWASPNKSTGNLYLNTKQANKSQQCIKLSSQDKGSKKAKGKFEIYLKNKSGQTSSTEILDDKETVFESKSVIDKLVVFEDSFEGEVSSAFIKYTKTYSGRYESRWYFENVEISGIEYCPVQSIFVTRRFVEYKKC